MILNSFKHACDIFADAIKNNTEYPEAVRDHLIVKENLKPLLEPDEEFRYIAGFPNYVVTSLGKVININTLKVLKPIKNDQTGTRVKNSNYYRYLIGLSNHGIIKMTYVHKLVAEAFLDKPAGDDLVVNHKNHDTSDNRVENLEWISRSENSKDQLTNRWANYSLEELLAVRKDCKYGSKEYWQVHSVITRRRKKLKDGTQGN